MLTKDVLSIIKDPLLPPKISWPFWKVMPPKSKVETEEFWNLDPMIMFSLTSPTTVDQDWSLSLLNTCMPKIWSPPSPQWLKRKCTNNWLSTWKPVKVDLCSWTYLRTPTYMPCPPLTPPKVHGVLTALPMTKSTEHTSDPVWEIFSPSTGWKTPIRPTSTFLLFKNNSKKSRNWPPNPKLCNGVIWVSPPKPSELSWATNKCQKDS